jgi:hypothetical protein
MKNIKFFEDFNSEVPSQEIHEGHDEMQNYMFFQNLHTLKNAIEELIELDHVKVDAILADGHGWALDHIATSVDDVEEVYHFLSNSIEMGHGGEDHEEHHEEGHDEDHMEMGIQVSPEEVEVETEEDEDEDED